MNNTCAISLSTIPPIVCRPSQAEQHIAWLTDEELYTTLRPLFGSDQSCLDAILMNGAEYQAVAGKLLEKMAHILARKDTTQPAPPLAAEHKIAPVKPTWRMRLAGSFHADDGAEAIWAAMMEAAPRLDGGAA